MAPLELNANGMTLITFLILVTILFPSIVEAHPKPENSHFMVSCGAKGTKTFHYMDEDISCLDKYGNNNCENYGLFAAKKAVCNKCCEAVDTTKTPTGHNDAPPASPKASSMPPWLIVVTAASVIIAGFAAFQYCHRRYVQHARTAREQIVISQNGSSSIINYVGLPSDGSNIPLSSGGNYGTAV